MHLAEITNGLLLMEITHGSSKSNGGLGIKSLSTGCVFGKGAVMSIQADLSFRSIFDKCVCIAQLVKPTRPTSTSEPSSPI